MSLSINSDYSQFYKGTEQIKSYGSGNGKKDTLVRYEFNTTDEHGNKVMDKMSKEESFRVMNDIASKYGENVLVSFSGDGLAALEISKGKLPITENLQREIPEGTFTSLEGPKVLSEEELSEMRKSGGTNMADVMRRLDPNAYKEYMSINEEAMEKGGTESIVAGFRYMHKWITNNANKNPNWMDSYDPEGKFEADHEIELSEKLNFVKAKNKSDGNGKSFYSVENSKNDLLEAYANMMDTIVKGHENGTRKSYVKDNGELREMTLQEELDALDVAFEKMSERSEKRLRKRDDEAKALENYGKQLSEINSNKADIPKETKEWIENVKKDPVPVDYKDKLISAAKMFTEQFKTNRGMGIYSILQNIAQVV